MDDLYVDTIIDRYRHPIHRGWIENALAGDIHKAHNPSCGDQFEVAFLFDNEKVIEAKWRGEGCAISTVAVDTFCEWTIGKSRLQIKEYSRQQIQDMTGVHEITSAREKCLYLPMRIF